MPITLDPAPIVLPDGFASRRKRFTRAETRALVEFGKLEAGKFELLQGDIVPKMGQNEPHVFVCSLVADLL
jgi:hypothetical protein